MASSRAKSIRRFRRRSLAAARIGSTNDVNEVTRTRLEAGSFDLSDQLAARVSAAMSAELVEGAPQPRVLGDGDDEAAAGTARPAHLTEHRRVVVDVFDDVERADRIEFRHERNASGVHLDQFDVSQPIPGFPKSAKEELAARSAVSSPACPESTTARLPPRRRSPGTIGRPESVPVSTDAISAARLRNQKWDRSALTRSSIG